ncbi:phage tail tape measure protein [Chromobacterium sinusclupearum]|uniref:Phage tail tape measure protein n=1 Tax=Chromobacterium sinusclupearum TaxID=2077146 RepID=A0A2K4MJ95_9NEIS|nr:phage tail tape measure protein [Chromobacterium sinusclupearum]POA97164.1 phage tail tape measure protein [Chromobacterium sinusclupearum]
MNSKLKIEVLLAAVDKLTRPLKQAMAGNQALARAVKESRDQLKQFQAAQSSIDAFRKLTKESKDTGQALAGARQRLEAVRQQMEQAGGASIKLSRKYAAAERAVDKLSMAHRKRLDAARAASAALQKEGIDTRQLSATETTLAARIQETNRALDARQGKLDAVARRQRLLNEAQQRYSQHIAVRDKIAGAGAKAAVGGAAIGATMAMPVMAYAQAEDAATQLKGAMMRAGGVIPPEFEQINRLAEKLGDRLPGTTADFQNMMTMLQRQGMSAQSVLGGLGEAAAYLGVQLKMTPEAAAEFTAKLQDATRTSEKDMMGLVDMIQRGFYAGVDPDNMLEAYKGLGAAMDMMRVKGLEGTKAFAPFVVMMDQAGMRGESAGNAIRKVIAASLNVDKIKKVQQNLRKQKGIALDLDFTNGKGEFGGLDKLMSQLNQLEKLDMVNRLAVLKDIFGDDKETNEVLSKIIDKGKDGYADVVKNLAEQASLQERVNQQLGTLKNLWDAASGTFTNAMVRFGEAISPELKAAAEWIGKLSERLGEWAKENPELANTIMRVLAFTGLALLAFAGLAIAIAGILGPIALARLSLSTLGIRAGGVVEKLVDLRKAGAGAGQSLSGKLSAGAAAAKRASQGLADAWRASSPREPLKRLWAWTKGLKSTLPAAMRAAGARSLELARAMGTGLVDKFKSGKLAVYKYTAALWRAVAAQLALARASAGAKLGAVTQYVKTRGVKGMAMDGLKGGGKLIGGGLAAAASGAASAIMGIGQALMFVGRLAMANPIGLIIGLAALLIYKYWEPIKAWFTGFWEGLKEGLAPLGAIFDQVFAAIGPALEPLRPVWDWLVGAFKAAWEWVSKLLGPVDASKQSLDAAANSGKGFGKWLANLIVIGPELAAKFITVGLDIMSGIVSGIKKGIVWVKDAILGVGDMLPEWLRKKLDIHSPSRVFATIGGHTMAGLEQGIDQGQAGPLASMREAAKRLTAAGAGIAIATAPAMAGQLDHRPPLRASAPAAVAAPTINITVNTTPGMNEQQLAAVVQRQVAQALAKAGSQQAAARRSLFGDFD